jgi:excisionase family DNA binding protein
MLSQDSADFRRSSNAPVMQGSVTASAERLLTVKEVAVRLKTSTATVCALCEAGRLAYVRISTHAIRIAAADLDDYVRSRRLQGKATAGAEPSR